MPQLHCLRVSSSDLVLCCLYFHYVCLCVYVSSQAGELMFLHECIEGNQVPGLAALMRRGPANWRGVMANTVVRAQEVVKSFNVPRVHGEAWTHFRIGLSSWLVYSLLG